MGLTNAYSVAAGRIPDLFTKIKDGQAPDQLSHRLLKDWRFTSSNDRAFIPLLKAIGFLSPDGNPTSRYHDYRDHSRSKAVMAAALREAYGDIFLIKAHPTEADKAAIEGKFKSYHNVSDNVATLMTRTFLALLPLADLKATGTTPKPKKVKEDVLPKENEKVPSVGRATDFHYNIQVHLPATKDVEVYNAIFKSLREHLVDE